jgi:hypothetical protein
MIARALLLLLSITASCLGTLHSADAQTIHAFTPVRVQVQQRATAGQRKGLAARFIGEPDSQLEATMSDLDALGATWLRVDFPWSEIQSAGPESYNTAPWDAIVRAASAHHIAILGVIDYCPSWANGGQGQFYPPTKPAAFATFSAFLATRYAPLGVHAWEIWNEPNGGTFWLPAADPVGYTNLLIAAYPAIKGVDATATVISGGLAPAADGGASLSPMTFLANMYAAGAGPWFDAVGDHPYTFPALPNAVDGSAYWWSEMFTGPKNLRSTMIANGDAQKRIWLTEFGAPTNGAHGSVSEERQAKMAEVAYALQKTYAWAGPLFWYTYRDGGTDPKVQEDWFGLIRHDGSHKPAYAAYKAVLPMQK